MLRSSLAALLLLTAPALAAAAKDATPPDAVAKQCELQARTDAGTPTVSPRSQANAAQPSDETTQRARSEGPAPTRATPKPAQPDTEGAEKVPSAPGADSREAYRTAYEACLRAQGR